MFTVVLNDGSTCRKWQTYSSDKARAIYRLAKLSCQSNRQGKCKLVHGLRTVARFKIDAK